MTATRALFENGADLESTGQGRPVVACRGASWPRKKDAH